jgi:hypothetical protein
MNSVINKISILEEYGFNPLRVLTDDDDQSYKYNYNLDKKILN